MARVAPPQFTAQLGIQSFPESCEVSGHLYGAVIRGQQMHHQGNFAACHARALHHAEKILQAARHPRWFAAFITHFGDAPARQFEARRGDPFQQAGIQRSFQRGDQAPGNFRHFRQTPQPVAGIGQRRCHRAVTRKRRNGRILRGELHARHKLIQFRRIHKPRDPRFHHLRGQQLGGGSVIHRAAARLVDHQIVIEKRAHLFHALALPVPFHSASILHAVREQTEQPFRFHGAGEANHRPCFFLPVFHIDCNNELTWRVEHGR